jgi:hypothetical protein
MALSKRTKDILEVSMADKKAAAEMAARADRQAATIAALGTTVALA